MNKRTDPRDLRIHSQVALSRRPGQRAGVSDPYAGLPVMRALAASPALVAATPFRGIHLALLLHPRDSLNATVQAACDLGADPEDMTLLVKDYAYPERDKVLAEVAAAGVRVAPLTDLKAQAAALEARLGGRPWLALEDGGHWAKEAYGRPGLLRSAVGFVEQTTRGVWEMERSGHTLEKPHLALPLSVIKKAFEGDFVGEAVKSSLAVHMGRPLAGASVAVLGAAGVIGAAVAEALRQAGMKVFAYDTRPPPYWALTKHGRITVCSSKAEAIAGRDVVVGATGAPVLDLDDLRWLKDGVLLASASSEQVEFPLALFRQLCPAPEPWVPPGGGGTVHGEAYAVPGGRRVVVLDGGRPINLGLAGSPEAECFDLIMALLVAGAAEVAMGRFDGQTGMIDDFDGVCARHGLEDLYRALHTGGDQ